MFTGGRLFKVANELRVYFKQCIYKVRSFIAVDENFPENVKHPRQYTAWVTLDCHSDNTSYHPITNTSYVNEIIRQIKNNVVNETHEYEKEEEFAWFFLFPRGINGLENNRSIKLMPLEPNSVEDGENPCYEACSKSLDFPCPKERARFVITGETSRNYEILGKGVVGFIYPKILCQEPSLIVLRYFLVNENK
uniref:Uncharacterized protein n=1 Tax=Glossina pallidipes TaxID=7398 RepID=A0A1A9Z9Y0_GLOPL